MIQSVERVADLISKYLQNELSPSENIELNNWVRLSSDNKSLFDQYTDIDLLSEKMQAFLQIEEAPLQMQIQHIPHESWKDQERQVQMNFQEKLFIRSLKVR